MGRAQQKSSAPRRLAVAAALAVGLGMVAAACGAGQVTQTDTQVAAVNGASGDVGLLSVRDAQLVFPVEEGHYGEGDDAPMVVTVVNNGNEEDKLVSVTSELTSGPAEITGDVDLEPSSAIISGGEQDSGGSSHVSTTSQTSGSAASVTATTTPSGSPTSGARESSSAPTTTTGSRGSVSNPPTSVTKLPSSAEPVEPGVVSIVLKDLTRDFRPGQTAKVTFVFEKAGELVLELPIGPSPEPRQGGEGGGH
ncbi:hypothetical protein [Saccharothrix coeruleofusca]|uniref:Copper(I)-binding protein n=1 Tax=Saccharothrix coeruleofusca TaxID=33919 RepID=A0A918AGT4_9PSEU|nr:hypothetical protein [Saccharothrix coeruleofusca]MBP2340414.1 copper(I)-binding protein [Saccharothrix coeruleofusca]GGP35499.1 hypothetical protein GCM10010185_02980 [Saccharothrix coeruleofusca]